MVRARDANARSSPLSYRLPSRLPTNSKPLPEAADTLGRDRDDTSFPRPLHPVKGEAAVRERSTEGTGKMWAALAPVETLPGKCPSLLTAPRHVHAQSPEQACPGGHQQKVAAARSDETTAHQRVDHLDAQSTGEMIVASSGEPKSIEPCLRR